MVRVVVGALITSSFCGPTWGQNKWQPAAQFFHTSFTTEQGAPGAVHVLAQTTDGFLWLGTETGLVRFDGVRFERYESPRFKALPFSNVSALLATPDGGLWIGYRTGGASFLQGEKVTSYGEKEGLPSAQIFQFAQDGDGTLWAATSRGLRRFVNAHWDTIGGDWGFDASVGSGLLADDYGRLWVVGEDALYVLGVHSHRFERSNRTHGTDTSIMQTIDGTVWMTPGQPGFVATLAMLPHGDAVIPSHKPRPPGCHAGGLVCAASDGSIWMQGEDSGVSRMPSSEGLRGKRTKALEKNTQQVLAGAGLKGDYMSSFLEDREGNIWIGKRTGVDRFRRRNVYRAPFPDGTADSDLSLVPGDDGAIWAAVEDRPLMEVRRGAVVNLGLRRHVASIYRDLAGALWIGGWSTLTRFANDRFEEVKLPTGLRPGTTWKVRAITADGSGALWISIVQHGTFRLKNTVWTQYGELSGLPKLTALILTTDSEGRVWFGYTENRAALYDGSGVRTFSASEGLNVGNVTAVGGRTSHVWVGGQYGLARFDGSRFQMLTTEADGDFRGISGIVEAENGDLWLNQTSGLAHLTASDIEVKLRQPHHPLHYELFDNRDGLRGTATQFNFLPSLALATDGRIWVSGTEGASWIDPTRIYRNPLPPPVSIQLLVADGRIYTKVEKIQLPPLPSNVEIDYTALSLSIPERVHFRYKLEGVDKDWQDVGSRRSAFYTKLAPGTYQFLVIACNNDGIWNETPTVWNFGVTAAFYQTMWFGALCLAVAAGVLWMFYQYRVRQATAHVQERLGVRLEERERIARELHDTLLQGFQGLMLRFQGVMKLLPEQGAAHQMMESVLDRADQVLLEGRDQVWELRSKGMDGSDLPDSLARSGDGFSVEHAIPFSLNIVGSPLPLDPTVCREIFLIGNEAVSNAFRHSRATKIEVEITYDRSRLRLRVRDDGRGIDATVLDSGRAGHWGLSGMRERAERIGAQLNIWSHSGAGTEVDLAAPGNVAYRRSRPVPAWARIRRSNHRK